jgi:hypothetical protein
MSSPAPAPVSNPPVTCSPACPRPTRRAFWTKQFYLWHWVSSAFALAAMIFFAFTGITLNHAGSISATPHVTQTKETLPATLLAQIAITDGEPAEMKRPLPTDVRRWLERNLDVNPGTRPFEWQEDEIYLDLPRPGGDGWLTISREDGSIHKEITSRGVIAWLNDLHKGRHTGAVWVAFMDFFSVVSVIFCLTGLALLFVHARRRPMTWPVVAAGILLPIFLILVFIHR